MGRGLAASLLLHFGLLAWVILGMADGRSLKSNAAVAVEVAIISKADLETRQKQGDVSSRIEESSSTTKQAAIVSKEEVAKPKPAEPAPPAASEPQAAVVEPAKPEPAKPELPKPVEAATSPPVAEPAKPEKPTEPKVDEIALALAAEAKARAEAEAQAKAEAEKRRKEAEKKRKEEEHKRAEAKRKADEAKAKAKAEADDKRRAAIIAAGIAGAADGPKPELLDKDPTKKAGGAATVSAVSKTGPKGSTAGSRDGHDSVNTASDTALITSMISQLLKECFKLPTVGGDSGVVPEARVSWRLAQDGRLIGEPKIVQKQDSPIGDQVATQAVLAVQRCNFSSLPRDKYQIWREINGWTFGPQRR